MNRVYFDVDFLMQPSRFAGATVFFNSIWQTAGKVSIKILGAPHSRRCFLKNVCFSVQNPVEMGIIFSKSMLKSARLIFCIVIRRKLPGTFYADSCCQNMQNHSVNLLQTARFSSSQQGLFGWNFFSCKVGSLAAESERGTLSVIFKGRASLKNDPTWTVSWGCR